MRESWLYVWDNGGTYDDHQVEVIRLDLPESMHMDALHARWGTAGYVILKVRECHATIETDADIHDLSAEEVARCVDALVHSSEQRIRELEKIKADALRVTR